MLRFFDTKYVLKIFKELEVLMSVGNLFMLLTHELYCICSIVCGSHFQLLGEGRYGEGVDGKGGRGG